MIFDTSGTSTYYRPLRHLAPGSRYIPTVPNAANILSVVSTSIGRLFGGRNSHLFFTRPRQDDLHELTALVERGGLRVPLEGVHRLAGLRCAHERSQTGRVVGKLAITVA